MLPRIGLCPHLLLVFIRILEVSGNKYFLDGIQQDTINLAEGYTYVFNYPSAHPFKFSTTSNGSHASGSEYTTGVTHNSSTQVTIVVATGAPTLYYYCSSHSNMGGTANTPAEAATTSMRYKVQTKNQSASKLPKRALLGEYDTNYLHQSSQNFASKRQ